jgi:hypothetical protein
MDNTAGIGSMHHGSSYARAKKNRSAFCELISMDCIKKGKSISFDSDLHL